MHSGWVHVRFRTLSLETQVELGAVHAYWARASACPLQRSPPRRARARTSLAGACCDVGGSRRGDSGIAPPRTRMRTTTCKTSVADLSLDPTFLMRRFLPRPIFPSGLPVDPVAGQAGPREDARRRQRRDADPCHDAATGPQFLSTMPPHSDRSCPVSPLTARSPSGIVTSIDGKAIGRS